MEAPSLLARGQWLLCGAACSCGQREVSDAVLHVMLCFQEALEWAMKNRLWGHALFLSSKMDPRTYSWVMSG